MQIVLSQLLKANLKLSFKRVLETSGHLWILFGVKLIKTFSDSKKKCRIGLFISNISKLFSLSLMLIELEKMSLLFD